MCLILASYQCFHPSYFILISSDVKLDKGNHLRHLFSIFLIWIRLNHISLKLRTVNIIKITLVINILFWEFYARTRTLLFCFFLLHHFSCRLVFSFSKCRLKYLIVIYDAVKWKLSIYGHPVKKWLNLSPQYNWKMEKKIKSWRMHQNHLRKINFKMA